MNYISQNIERCNFNNEFIFTFTLFYVLSNLFFNILDNIYKGKMLSTGKKRKKRREKSLFYYCGRYIKHEASKSNIKL
jgi:hypothetical protein